MAKRARAKGPPRPDSKPAPAGRRTRLLPPAVLGLTFAGLLAFTFGGWADSVLDFGWAVEVSRQLALGKVLQRDVATLHGPLPPYLLSLVFRVFGPSLLAAAAFQVALLLGILGLLFNLLERIASRFAATVACMLFLVVFAFGQYTPAGNYNFVTPYSPEITHGLFFSLLAFLFLHRFGARGRAVDAALAGFCLGLSFLTKAEVFLAAAVAALTGLALLARARGRAFLSPAALFLGASLIPPAAAFLLFTPAMPPAAALRAALGPWPAILEGSAAQLPFFSQQMGTLDVFVSLAALSRSAFLAALVFGLAAAAAFLARRWDSSFRPLAGLALGALSLYLATTWRSNAWFEGGRALPLVALAIVLAALFRREGPLRGRQLAPEILLRILFGTFSVVLLGKMLLAVRVVHYGFALAGPAALLAVVALVEWVPRRLDAGGADGSLFRLFSLAVLAIFAGVFLANTAFWYSRKTCTVHGEGGSLRADERGCVVQEALEDVGRRLRPGETLAVLPEGAMINFLARRSNPTPFGSLMPPEALSFGEARVTASYRDHPPDWILLAHRDTSEFGPRFFGRDYAVPLMEWILTQYEDAALYGAPPFESDAFGIRLLKKK